jgi:hypothetical protein
MCSVHSKKCDIFGKRDVSMKFHSDWKIAQWHYVERVVNNDLARIVGMIPLVGYLILFNDEIADMASFRAIAGVEGDNVSPFFLSSLTKMRLIFFGSLLLLIANVIFKALRPQVLELSKGDMEFSTRVRDSYSVHELASMEEQVFSDHWKPRLPSFWKVFDRIRTKAALVSGFRPDHRAAMFSKHGDYIHFLAREWWTGMMHTFRVARLASMILGITGYAFLAVPTFDISQAVLRNILTSFWAALL